MEFLLNKRRTTVKFNSKEINPLTGSGLKTEFNNYIGSEYLNYVERKIAYLSKFEKEGRKKIFQIRLNSELDIRAMANCFLGYDEEFKIDAKEYLAPFGIMDKEPHHIVENHKTKISPIHNELPKAKISLKNSEFGKQFVFDGTIYTVPKHLPRKVARLRLKTTLFD
jgi:hypothetical protein